MPSTFPGAIDSFTDPLSNSPLNSPSHSTLHSDINDAVEKVEQYMGLVKVIPSSVSSAGGTAATLNSTTGTVTIGSGNTSITITNLWSSLYDNYRLEIETIGGGSANITMQLRTASATTTTNYKAMLWTPFVSYTSGAAASQTSTTAMIVGYNETTGGSCSVDLSAPFASRPTRLFGNYSTDLNTGPVGSVQTDSTSFVSAVFALSSGAFGGGTIRVYGYRN